MESVRRDFLVTAMLLILSIIAAAEENTISSDNLPHIRAKRQAARMLTVVTGGPSNCTVSCGGGVRTMLPECVDQDGVVYPFCSSTFTKNCCPFDDYLINGQPVWFETCNQQSCDANPPPDPPYTPGAFQLNTSSIVNIQVANDNTTTIMIIFNTQRIQYTFTHEIQPSGGLSNRAGFQVTNPSTITLGNNLIIDGTTVMRSSGYSFVRYLNTTNETITYSGNNITYSTGVAGFTAAGIPTYYYISSLGIAYVFTGTKGVQDVPTGLLLVQQDSFINQFVAVYSQSNTLNTNLFKTLGGLFSVSIVNGGNVSFNFEFSTQGAIIITSSTVLNNAAGAVSYSSSSKVLQVGSSSYSPIDRVIRIGDRGFEDTPFQNTETAFLEYDSFFINNRNAVFSVGSRMTNNIFQQIIDFFRSGGTPTAQFTVSGNALRFAGFNVITLSDISQTVNIASGVALTHVQQQILYSSNTIPGIAFFASETSSGGNTFSINGGTIPPVSGPGVLYISGDTAFFTASQSTQNAITSATSTQTITASTATFTTTWSNGVTSLTLNGNNIVDITGFMNLALRNGDSIRYNGGTITLSPPDSRGPFTGISQLTYYRAGAQNIFIYPSPSDETISVDSSYRLYINGNQAVLVNAPNVIDLVNNPVFAVSTRTNSLGQTVLTIGGSDIIILDSSVEHYDLGATDDISYSLSTLTGSTMAGGNIFNVQANTVYQYRTTDTSPRIRDSISFELGPLSVYYRPGDRTAFITDRQTIINLISSITSTLTVQPTPLPPTTTPVIPPIVLTTTPPIVLPTTTIQPSPSPVPTGLPPSIIDKDNGQSLFSGTTQVIILTGGFSRDISGNERVIYNDNVVTVLDNNDNVVFNATNIRKLGVYQSGSTNIQFYQGSGPNQQGPGKLYINQLSGEAFFTHDQSTINVINSFVPPANLRVVNRAISVGRIGLTIGGADVITLTGSTRTTIDSRQYAIISSTGYLVYDNATGNLIFNITTNSNRVIQYFRNDSIPAVSTGGTAIRVNGPVTIATDGIGGIPRPINGFSTLITNRDDVIRAITEVVCLEPKNRTEPNGDIILIIGGMDIIVISRTTVHYVEYYEYVSYRNFVAINTNVITEQVADMTRTYKFTVYTPNHATPEMFTNFSNDTYFGPGYFYYTDNNESFFVSCPETYRIIFSMFNETAGPLFPPTPGPTAPPIIIPPQSIIPSTLDGASWFPSQVTLSWSQCSESTCGVRVRFLKCQRQDGTHSTSCTDPLEQTSRLIPPSIELCGNAVPGCIPNSAVIEPDIPDGVGTVYIVSDNNTGSYYIEFEGVCSATGSTYNIIQQQVDGVTSVKPIINLQTTPTSPMPTISVSDFTMNLVYDPDNIFSITVIPTNGIPADECHLVNNTVMKYEDSTLTFNSMTITSIAALFRADTIRLTTFVGYLPSDSNPPHTVAGPLYVCIDYSSGFNVGLYTTDLTFITDMMNAYDQLVGSLKAPQILGGSAPPMSVISTSGQVFQVGTTPISVLEQIHKFSLRCKLSEVGNPPVTSYTWRKDGQLIVDNNVKYSIVGDILTIKNTEESDQGTYRCSVSNSVGSAQAMTFLDITQEPEATSPPLPTTPPPLQPRWVPQPFTRCNRRCDVGIQVRAILCLLGNEPSTQCNGTDMPPSYQLCNTQDCPGTVGSRNGIPINNASIFHVSIPNGNFEIYVNVSDANNVTGTYELLLTAVYPDSTEVINHYRQESNMVIFNRTSVVMGPLLFAKLQAIRTYNRIDIYHLKIIASIHPYSGDKCYNFGTIDQFIYSNKTIISSSLPQRIIPTINFVISAQYDGIFSYDRYDVKLFQGPFLLCISTFYGRAFVTNVKTLAEDVWGHYTYLLLNTSKPEIYEDSGTLTFSSNAQPVVVNVGTDVVAPNGTYININTILKNPGIPPASNVVWRLNGQVITTDPDKNVYLSNNKFTVILTRLARQNAGWYQVTVSNFVGSDSAGSAVSYFVPNGFDIVVTGVDPGNDPTVLNVGIGLSYQGNSNLVKTVVVICQTTNTTETDMKFRINGVDVDPNDINLDINIAIPTGTLTHTFTNVPSGSLTYACVVSDGTTEKVVASFVTFKAYSVPSVTITGETQLKAGGSTILTCTSSGVPQPVALFDIIRPGNIISDFIVFTNGSILIYNAKPNDNTEYCCSAVNSVNRTVLCTTIIVKVPPMIAHHSKPPATNVPLSHGTQTVTMDVTIDVGQDAIVAVGTTVNIRCNVTQGSPMPEWQWYKDGMALTSGDAQSRVLMLDLVTLAEDGIYECRVRNDYGSDAANTKLSVFKPPIVRASSTDITNATAHGSVVTVKQKSDLVVLHGLSFCLRCDVDRGVPPAEHIAWRFNGEGISIRDICLSVRANETELCFTNITRPYSGMYQCFVMNEAGSDDGGINVTVAVPPRIKAPRHHMVPAPGFCDNQESKSYIEEDVGVGLCVTVSSKIMLHCIIDETTFPPADVVWSIKETNMVLTTSPGITVFSNNSLLIDSIDLINRTYVCMASNIAGKYSRETLINVTGVPPTIEVNPPLISRMGRRKIISVGAGTHTVNIQLFNETLIKCDTKGRPKPTISWTINGQPVTSTNAFMIQPDGSLLIMGLSTTACAVYTCTATNPLEMDSQSVTVCGESYNCQQVGFGPCSASCGRGIREHMFKCTRKVNNVDSDVELYRVPSNLRPAPDFTECLSVRPCPIREYRYRATGWGRCSHHCGGGIECRQVECILYVNGVAAERVHKDFCVHFANQSTFPSPLSRPCNEYSCPEWRTDPFGPCDQYCGYGNQTRNVYCISPANNNMTLDDRFCEEGTRPESIRRCKARTCPYLWAAGAWDPCSSTCQGGTHSRVVSCYNASNNQIISDSFCEGLPRPISFRLCGVGVCPPKFTWITGEFGSCSVTCGQGVRTRSVSCRNVVTNQIVDKISCSEHETPSATEHCDLGRCPGICTTEHVLCRIVPSALCSVNAIKATCCITCA